MRKLQWILVVMLGGLMLTGCGSSNGNGGGQTFACNDGRDNDNDGLIDFPADPGCLSELDASEEDLTTGGPKTRYAMANRCWAIRANGNDSYLRLADGAYSATATAIADAEPFYLKPSSLGHYLLYSSVRDLITASGGSTGTSSSAGADDSAEWLVKGRGDATEYPPTPAYHTEPAPEQVALWHGFVDPQRLFTEFTLYSGTEEANLSVDAEGALVMVAPGTDADLESFSFEPLDGCAQYPEASSDFSGEPFDGTTTDGRVLGHADVHVHISATEFLGGAQHGRPFHKFGVEHALPNCSSPEAHGPQGSLDLVQGAFTQDTDGHATDGWPSFTEWPARGELTHEAIYWKWLERSWASGLRVVVNDLVDNRTLCELQRNAKGDPSQDCNSMNNAGRQAGTMYAMENYIDAQYGGPGQGFFQIVHSPEEARAVIADGKMAVVLGIEISNLFDCQLTYAPNPLRADPSEEDGSGLMAGQNAYGCTVEEGQPNSILTQMQRVHDWGVRQIISIHEFDNAFGGNGIFDGMVLNLGNKENSGGLLSSDLDLLTSGAAADFFANADTLETPTGEFWTTFDCPVEEGDDATPGFSGYFWGNAGGSAQSFGDAFPFGCVPMGQGGRSGGPTPCYPSGVRQCNARWMTPAGQYMFGKLMEMGFIIDFDHLAVGMKSQLLEFAEAQSPVYPLVSTHGTFGGITNDHARRVLAGGGHLYPSNGSSGGFINNMEETLAIYEQAMAGVPEDQRPLFGFGYGTDTNGLSSQTGPRNNPERPLTYPFILYGGTVFDDLDDFAQVPAVIFEQPASRNASGEVVRTWHQDEDGNAHHGMLSGFVQEIRLDGTAEHMQHLFNSAEVYLQTWERTEAASAAIAANGLSVPDGMLRPAPVGTPTEDPFASPAAP